MNPLAYSDAERAAVYRAIAERRDMRHFLPDPVCPEVLGGLKTPREAAEVLTFQEKLTVKTVSGKDVTEAFIIGAGKALKVAKENKITTAILKARSPSCGCSQIYDGTFSKKIVNRDGITAALLKLNGIKVITEEEIMHKLKKLSDNEE